MVADEPDPLISAKAAVAQILANLGMGHADVAVIVAACVPYIVVDLETQVIVMVSDLTSETFGYVPGELIGKCIHDLVPVSIRQRHTEHVASFAANPSRRRMGTQEMLLRGVKRDGSEFSVEIGLEPRAWGGRRFVVATILPVSQILGPLRDTVDNRFNENEATHKAIIATVGEMAKDITAIKQAVGVKK